MGGARNRGLEYNPGNYRADGLRLRGARPAVEPASPVSSDENPKPRASASDFLLAWGSHISGRGHIQDHAAIADLLLPKPFVEMHPRDAAELGVKDDQFVVLTVDGQRAKAAVRVCRGPAPGVLYLPAKVYGSLDASRFAGPVAASVEVLAQSAPTQTDDLLSPAAAGESR
jgi:anaerobic selenocysteine-containing dehydrogenase